MSATSTDQPLPRYSYLLVLVAALIAHGFSLRAQFYMDDYMHLIESDRLIEGDGLFSWRRLLPYLAYFLIYKVAGFAPVAYHALNLAIHLVFSVFVLWSMRDFERFLLGSKNNCGGSFSLPVVVALIFACHPLGSEPVNYARCTPILLVGAFSYAAAWATLRWFCVPERRGVNAAIVLIAVAGATFSKEPGFVHALGSVVVVAWFCKGLVTAGKATGFGSGRSLVVQFLLIVLLAFPAVTKPLQNQATTTTEPRA